jgi:hypothetical protein
LNDSGTIPEARRVGNVIAKGNALEPDRRLIKSPEGAKPSHLKHARKALLYSLILLLASLAHAQTGSVLLDQTKTVPAGHDWNREVVNRLYPGGKIRYRIDAPGPFSLTVLTDRGYQMLLKLMKGAPGKLDPSDVLMTKDFKGPVLESSINLKPGSHWFMITNNLPKPAKLRLRCWMEKK